MSRRFTRYVMLLLTAGLAAPAAAWPPEGASLCTVGVCQPTSIRICADGMGGAFVAWGDSRNEVGGVSNRDLYVQHVLATGEIAPGWPATGLPVCTDPAQQFIATIAADGFGGVLIAWEDWRDAGPGGTLPDIYVQRVLADGTLASGWPVNGAAGSRASTDQRRPIVIADGTGGAYVTWSEPQPFTRDIHLQHLTATGTVAPGWPADGLPVCVLPGTQTNARLAPDGTGGVYVGWNDDRDGTLSAYLHRVQHDGTSAAGWPLNGTPVDPGRPMDGLEPDAVGGVYVASAPLPPPWEFYLHRLTGTGAPSTGWPPGGAPVCLAPNDRDGLRMAGDGGGGALLAWYDYRDYPDEIYLLRMQADGTRHPAWPEDGLRVTDNGEFDAGPELSPDGQGGAYLTWQRYADTRVMVQHVTGLGAVASGWPAGGHEIPSPVTAGGPRITSDGMGGAIVAWQQMDGSIRALRVAPDSPTATLVALVRADVEPGLVRLEWYAAEGAGLLASVERRISAGEWTPLAEIRADGIGRLRYEDHAVSAGERFGYRLAYWSEGGPTYTAETWIEVPGLRFALEGLTPNPSSGDPVVRFTLPRAGSATLELFDLGGRRIFAREVGGLGAGAHEVRLSPAGRLAAGVYAIRLRQGADVARARAVVMR